MHIVRLEHIHRSAALAAERHLGPRANPYPEGSAAHAAWLDAYRLGVRERPAVAGTGIALDLPPACKAKPACKGTAARSRTAGIQ